MKVGVRLNIQEVKENRQILTELTKKFQQSFVKERDIEELMELRGYLNTPYEEQYRKLFKEIGIWKMPSKKVANLINPYSEDKDMMYKLGLSNIDMLEGRFIVPIRDIGGSVTAWIGWLNDYKKYITTPTQGFSKKVQMLCEETYVEAKKQGKVFLVEGIFDALAIRMLGLSSLSVLGADISLVKTKKLKRYDKIVCIPDNDKVGYKSNPYIKQDKDNWRIENDNVFLMLPQGIKDVDDLCKNFNGVKELLLEVSERSGFVKL